MAMKKKPPKPLKSSESCGYTQDDLEVAVSKVKCKELSFRQAEARYGVPRSTLSDHVCGKVSSTRRGPPTILTSAEENMLVHWAIEMAAIGYGRTREELCLTVKAMLDKDGRANPFRQNMPGKDWWYAFLKRHPEISQRTPEVL